MAEQLGQPTCCRGCSRLGARTTTTRTRLTTGRLVALSLLLVSLFAFSLAASSPKQQDAWRRVDGSPAALGNLEPIYERPRQVLEANQPQEPDGQEYDADDERFLRQLKLAARYLDEKLAERQREQQQEALLSNPLGLGKFLEAREDGPAVGRQGPAYSLPVDVLPAGAWQLARDAPATQALEADLGGSNDVLVVAPTITSARVQPLGLAGEPEYRVLEQPEQQQQPTDDKYKQLLLKSLLLDKAQAQAAATPGEPQAAAVKRQLEPAEGDDEQPDEQEEDQQQQQPQNTSKPKVTTLLEDEPNEDDEQQVATRNATTPKPAGGAYGKVLTHENKEASGATGGNVFNRMYARLSHYLPFINQISILRQPASGPSGTKPEGNGPNENASDEPRAKQSVSVSTAQAGEKSAQGEEQEKHDKHLKVKVNLAKDSDSPGDQTTETKNQDNGGQDKAEDKRAKSKEAKVSVSLTKSENSKRLSLAGSSLSPSSSSSEGDESESDDLEVDMSQMVPVVVSASNNKASRPRRPTSEQLDDNEDEQEDEHSSRYNLMRQSSLVLPKAANPMESLMGKYIYAPTQHYYLNGASPATAAAASSTSSHQRHLLVSPGGAGKRLLPGDEIFGSYEGMGAPLKSAAAYATYQKDPNVIMSQAANKANDLYFLVMVGAFCVMAMAVVLAAGMFAYRIQQSRKSSQDTDYPTYGVVGPNNMSGKCGAAAFTMGNYFVGPSGGSSKSGSAKHLADLYTSAHGTTTGGSDSGLNSLDKSSLTNNGQSQNGSGGGGSSKKAASVSSLNNDHHQQHHHSHPSSSASSTARNTPSSFMAAASQDAARMYHYQHQKQQMIISDRNSAGGRHTSASDLDSEDENDDGSYTVYECPGLASAHEMEIKNPLFNDDQSP